jgi:hypothetical protein
MTSLQAEQARTRLLELSDERDLWLRRLLAEYRAGYARGREAGYAEGWAAAEQADERAWHAAATGLLSGIPGTPQHRESVNRRLRAAEAGCRRDAWEHWREWWAETRRRSHDEAYLREVRMMDSLKRSPQQIMALMLHDARRAAA